MPPAVTCAPPPEHADKEWHWLRYEDSPPEPVRWHGHFWERAGYWLDPSRTHELGWRYVGPAIPPQEGEGW